MILNGQFKDIMETQEKYMEQAEIKVKNILSYLYEEESDTLKEISKLKETMHQKITSLEKKYEEVMNQRRELEEKFNHLKEVTDDQWETSREDFELFLQYAEIDRETFIQKAESLIENIGGKIQELEEKTANVASETRESIHEKIKNLNISRNELRARVDKIKENSGEQWKDIKDWFAEKSKSVKEYISSIGHN